MLFDSSSVSHLKPWLVRTLEPICDAEPGALADYILALLKHNVPESEMRNELAVQLDEFLEKAACASFIDTLFTVLRTKSYLPYATSSPSSPSFATKTLDTGIPIPLDGLLSPSISDSPDRNRKRSIENDERDGRPPAKGPRLSTEGQFSRYTNGHGGRPENRSTGGWGSRVERPSLNGYRESVDIYGGGMGVIGAMGMASMNGTGPMNNRRPQVYQPPDQKRGICRDYHNNGYCARGVMCKYSHGEDAVVPGQLYPMNAALAGVGMPFMPMFPGAGIPFGMGGGVGAAYDPHEARMDMRPIGGRPQQRAPLLPRIQQEDGSQIVHSVQTSGELPVIQDLTPNIPAEDKSDPRAEQQSLEPLPESRSDEQVGYGPRRNGDINGQPYMPMNMDVDPTNPTGMGIPGNQHGHSFRSTMRGGRSRGGTFGGESHNFRPERRNDKTLVVEKIPEDKMTLEHVNEWFKRFGTVTNVAIDSSNAKALISFATHDEAYAAWKSEDAVFNNRFVKLFWHRPMEGHGQVGARMLAASAPLVANITNPEPPVRPVIPPTVTSGPSRKPSAAVSSLAAKHQQLEQQIAEQKSLMESLNTASPKEKKTIMARLRKLGEEMKPPSTDPAPISSTRVSAKPVGATNKVNDHEQKERERLDKELELHNTTGTTDGDSPEALAAKLERLKAEAASLGIVEASTESTYGGNSYPYRGRGRGGRGYLRGAMRGGPVPRGSMKLDNRPKKLIVKGVHDDGVQALRDWFETAGQMESLETIDSGDVVVTFKSRAAAEQGLAKGHTVPAIGVVQIAWYTGQNVKATPVVKAVPPETGPRGSVDTLMSDIGRPRSPEPPTIHSPRIQEEEVVASGWGADSDGEDGMGML
ncbi:hypothetical protein BDZ94DRAFT_1276397 [Collybia nuda]|uniref:Uncharacterized protein n=1 Tax=Collybia nuda TaxID=64659 RepID=A0A9P6C8F3_9AGAR|nr:hypothetical protein BDZ94DRAFT_1276397 [Collybia nuda]